MAGSDVCSYRPERLFFAQTNAIRAVWVIFFVLVGGCARSDWIESTLVTVDVTVD